MYRLVIKPILYALSVEQAHKVVLYTLRVLGLMPMGRWLLRRNYAVKSRVLEREVFGLKFSNPIGIAAGFDCNGEVCRELSALGFGFVEIGTVTPLAQSGNPKPRIFRLPKDRAIVSRVGYDNQGLESVVARLREPRKGTIVGCNIGKNTVTPLEKAPLDYLKTFRNLYQYSDYFTININCYNASNECMVYTKDQLMAILEPLFSFRRGQGDYRPIMLKISPDITPEMVDNIVAILKETPLDGIVATMGTYSRKGLRTSFTTIDKVGLGRLSGAPLTSRALEIVREIHEKTEGRYPIIGTGGLMSVADVKAMFEAGAHLVQLYSGYIYEGPNFIRDICDDLVLDAKKREAVRDIENSINNFR